MGEHEFDCLCEALGIEHRLTRPKSPQSNEMVERFNGRIEQVLRSHRFVSGELLEQTLLRYVWLYNEHLPQKNLSHRTPIQAMKHGIRLAQIYSSATSNLKCNTSPRVRCCDGRTTNSVQATQA